MLYAIFAIPAVFMLYQLAWDDASADILLHGSGELSARFMLIALAVTPLRSLWPQARWTLWLRQHRRALGVAALFYAALHTLFYVVDMGVLRYMLEELGALGIWTGWLALFILALLALTSNAFSIRCLKAKWQHLHRLVYLAAVLVLVHWIYIHNSGASALAHFVPLIILEGLRVKKSGWRQVVDVAARDEL